MNKYNKHSMFRGFGKTWWYNTALYWGVQSELVSSSPNGIEYIKLYHTRGWNQNAKGGLDYRGQTLDTIISSPITDRQTCII